MPDGITVPRACSTVLPPFQRNKNAAVAPWSNAARTAMGQHGGLTSEDHNFHFEAEVELRLGTAEEEDTLSNVKIV